MHIAAFPDTAFVTRDQVPAETVETERRLARETAIEEGKPEGALAKIVEGRLSGFFKEKVLVEQPFAKDSKKTVGAVLTEAGVTPVAFARFRVGA
jgi:elongation factor Ts